MTQPPFFEHIRLFLRFSSLVKRGIDGVKILTFQMLLRDAEGVGETVRVKHLTSCESYSTINLVIHSSGKTYSISSILIEYASSSNDFTVKGITRLISSCRTPQTDP